MKIRRLASLLLTMAVLLNYANVFSVARGEQKSSRFTYVVLADGTAKITDFDWSGNSGNTIKVPKTVDGHVVSTIGKEAFRGSQYEILTEVGLMADVVLPDTVTCIKEKAFYNSSITSINITQSITKIGAGAFAGTYITNFIVAPENETYATIDGSLYNKKTKELVAWKFPNSLGETVNVEIPDGIVSIGDYAFYGMGSAGRFNFTKPIPETVVSIGNSAFEFSDFECNILDLLPSSLESIGNCAFNNSHGLDSSSNVFSLPQNVNRIGTGCFSNSKGNCTSIDLTSTQLKAIPDQAFYKFGDEETECKVFLPDTVERVGAYAFSYACCNLMIGDNSSLSFIGDYAFYNIQNTKLVLPESVRTIGSGAFGGTALEEIVLPEGVEAIGDDMCERTVLLDAQPGSYAAKWAEQNGYKTTINSSEDTSWLSD